MNLPIFITKTIKKGDSPIQFPIDEILDDKKRLVRGFVSAPVKDSQGDLMPHDELKRTMNTLMERGGVINDEHSNRGVGKILRWFEEEHPDTKEPAIAVDYMIFDDYSIDDEVWQEIKDKKRKGLSFGGRATEKPTMKKDGYSGETARNLKGVEAYEVSSVAEPACDLAFNTHINFLAKSKKGDRPDKLDRMISIDMFDKDYNDLKEEDKKKVTEKKKDALKVLNESEDLINDFQKGYATKDNKKSFSGFKDFEECESAQKEKGHTDESSKRICGFLQNRSENKTKGKIDSVGNVDRDEIDGFLSTNPNPTDDQVHNWAEEKGYDKEEVEEALYRLATEQNKTKNKLEGGLADEKNPNDFDKEQLAKGVIVEMEHTNDTKVAIEIAMDHLTEDPEYYSKLETIERNKQKPDGEHAHDEENPYGEHTHGENKKKHIESLDKTIKLLKNLSNPTIKNLTDISKNLNKIAKFI